VEEEVMVLLAHLHTVVPAKAGTHLPTTARIRFASRTTVGPRLRGDDDVVDAKSKAVKA
jgi:hypothetical protein